MHRSAVALGSNLPSRFGSPEANVRHAIEQLAGLGAVIAFSRMYETEPVGYTDQPWFVNGAAVLETELAPQELLRGLLGIERQMGRDRSASAISKGPRVIDLDLLMVDHMVLRTPELTLPHPEMERRRFVLEPLAEIAPDWVNPMSGHTVMEMLGKLP